MDFGLSRYRHFVGFEFAVVPGVTTLRRGVSDKNDLIPLSAKTAGLEFTS